MERDGKPNTGLGANIMYLWCDTNGANSNFTLSQVINHNTIIYFKVAKTRISAFALTFP